MESNQKERKAAYESGDSPDYYTGKYLGIKVRDVLDDFGLTNTSHYKSSAVEYILRAGKKDDERQDILKAINHLQMWLDFLEKEKNYLK